MNGPATEIITSPTMPLPPIPRTTMFSISSCLGSLLKSSDWAAACSTCSGNAIVASHIPSVSRRSVMIPRGLRPGTSSACGSPALARPDRLARCDRSRRLERRLDAVGLGLRHQTAVFGVVDRLGLVDEHDRDVVLDGVLALQARVVQHLFALEVQEGAFVLRASEDVQQLGVE